MTDLTRMDSDLQRAELSIGNARLKIDAMKGLIPYVEDYDKEEYEADFAETLREGSQQFMMGWLAGWIFKAQPLP